MIAKPAGQTQFVV